MPFYLKLKKRKKMDSRNDKLKNIAVLIFKSFKQVFILPRVNWYTN